MAWLSRNTWIASDKPTNTDFNNFANDLRTWGGNVDAGANSLTNLGGVLLNAGAKLGIGTASPAVPLHLVANAAGSTQLANFYNSGSGDGVYQFIQIGKSEVSGGCGHINYYVSTGTPANAYISIAHYGDARDTAGLNVRKGGKVGIGTATPLANLQVGNVTGLVEAAGNSHWIANCYYASGWKYLTSNYAGLFNMDSVTGTLGIYTAPSGTAGNAATVTQRVWILTGGNVGIGKSPAYQLELSTDSAGKPTTSTWTVSSDMRLKRKIQDMTTDPVAMISKLRFITAEYNGLGGTPAGEKMYGLVAQEARIHMPHMVRTYKAKLQDTDESDTDMLGLDYHALIIESARAIQQLDARLKKAGV